MKYNPVEWIAFVLGKLLEPFAEIAGRCHLKIGHGTATGGFFLMIGICAYAAIWGEYHGKSAEQFAAEARSAASRAEIDAASAARAREQFKKDFPDVPPPAPLPAFDEASAQATAEGVSITYRVLASATVLTVSWAVDDGGASDIKDYSLGGTAGQLARLDIPASSFGAAWASGKRVVFSLAQKTPGGTAIYHRRAVVLVP